MRNLTNRAQFLNAARGLKINGRFFALQVAKSAESEPGVGFTVTKRIGNAPVRNRIKRRLRAATRHCADEFKPQYDYVLIGRRAALAASFDELVKALCSSLQRAETLKNPTSPAHA